MKSDTEAPFYAMRIARLATGFKTHSGIQIGSSLEPALVGFLSSQIHLGVQNRTDSNAPFFVGPYPPMGIRPLFFESVERPVQKMPDGIPLVMTGFL